MTYPRLVHPSRRGPRARPALQQPEQVKNASDAMAVLGLDVAGREQVVEPVRALGEGTGHGPHS